MVSLKMEASERELTVVGILTKNGPVKASAEPTAVYW